MRKTIFGCLGAAAVAFTLQFTPANAEAGLFDRCAAPCDEVGTCDADSCDPCDAVCNSSKGKWFVNGHLEAGFFANAKGATGDYSGTATNASSSNFGSFYPFSGNTSLLQNTRLTGAQINQVYISAGKSVNGKRGLDIGGTFDFTFGSDAYVVQSRGLEKYAGHGGGTGATRQGGEWGTGDYYSAIAQAYAEIAYKKWNVKVGKFYTPFGSSVYKSTDNFFYTWAPTFAFVPATAGGAYATYAVNDKLSAYGGWVTPDELGETKDYNAFLGGIVWQATKRLNLHYAFAAGENHYDNQVVVPVSADFDVFVNSLVTTYTLNKWKVIFDWSFTNVKLAGDPATYGRNHWIYGINNEIIYQWNKKWAFGTRFGAVRGETLFIPGGEILFATNSTVKEKQDWAFVSIGANWTPTKWLTVKPEVRYDWVDGDDDLTPFDNGNSKYQFSGGLSTVVKF